MTSIFKQKHSSLSLGKLLNIIVKYYLSILNLEIYGLISSLHVYTKCIFEPYI